MSTLRNTLSGLALCLIASISAASAAPVVLTFDVDGNYPVYTEKGLTITPILGSTAVPISGGTFDLPCCSGPNNNFSFTTGGLFDFLSLDFLHSDNGDPYTFTGFFNNVQVAQQIVNGNDVGTVAFSGFTGVDLIQVNFGGSYYDPEMDNLTYQAVSVAVPEPASLALLGTGLLGLGFIRRRKA